jgi:H/ACA ribonucleoprotein complex subunit 4
MYAVYFVLSSRHHVANKEQKYGRTNEATPAKWQLDYKDFHAPVDVPAANVVGGTTQQSNALSAPPVAHVDTHSVPKEDEASKKRKHIDETEEAKAEKKQKKKGKKEKKEKKEKRKSLKAEDGRESI